MVQIDEATGRTFADLGNEERTIPVFLPSITRVSLGGDIHSTPTLQYKRSLSDSVSSLTVNEDYILLKDDERDPVYRTVLFDQPFYGLLAVTAEWGWPDVPDAVKTLNIIAASAILLDSPLAFGGTEQGTEDRTTNEYVYDVLADVVNRYKV